MIRTPLETYLREQNRAEEQKRAMIQEAIDFANAMPIETRCGVIVKEYPGHVDIEVSPEVPFGEVHRFQFLAPPPPD